MILTIIIFKQIIFFYKVQKYIMTHKSKRLFIAKQLRR